MTTPDHHSAAACPCRKRHCVGPKPPAPEGPPNAGKQTRRLRDALERLHKVSFGEDENVIARLRQQCDLATTPEVAEYRRAFEAYLLAFTDWSSDLCGDCGVSLLCPTAAPGCPRCVAPEVEALRAEVAALRATLAASSAGGQGEVA